MTQHDLSNLADIIEAAEEDIYIDTETGRLRLKTDKNDFMIGLSVAGFLFSVVVLWFYDRKEHNLQIGLIALFISLQQFWEHQRINKTLIFDLTTKSMSIIPTLAVHRWLLEKVFKLEPAFSFADMPNLKLTSFYVSKSRKNYRIYFLKGLWPIRILEFKKEETAQKVLNLLQR